MFQRLLLLMLTSFLSANTLYTVTKHVSLDEPFIIKSDNKLFDTSIAYTHQELLDCLPKLKVVYKIESKQQLKVIPQNSLKNATNYECSYKDISFQIQTVPLQLNDIHYFSKAKILRLEFNDKITVKMLKMALILNKIDKLSKTKLNFTILEHNRKTMVIKINESVGEYPIEMKLDLKGLKKPFIQMFNVQKPIQLDKDKKRLKILNKPQMIALDTGGFALRLFLDDTLEGNPEKSIQIEGINNFTLNKNNYIDYNLRENFKVSDEAYYYTDIISPDFKPNHNYHLTLKRGLHSYKELKKDKTNID